MNLRQAARALPFVAVTLMAGCKSNVQPITTQASVQNIVPSNSSMYTNILTLKLADDTQVSVLDSFKFPVKVGQTYTVCLTPAQLKGGKQSLQGVYQQTPNGEVVALGGKLSGDADTEFCGKRFDPRSKNHQGHRSP